MQNKIIFYLFIVIGVLILGGLYMLFISPITFTSKTDTSTTTTESGISIVSSSTLGNDLHEEIEVASTSEEVVLTETRDTAIYTGSEVPGNRFSIDYAHLTEDGFIVIYENGAEPMGEVLGTSVFLPKGEYTNVPILLARNVTHGEVFDAVLHKDNGDRVFNILTDGLFKNSSGFGVITHISVLDIPTS